MCSTCCQPFHNYLLVLTTTQWDWCRLPSPVMKTLGTEKLGHLTKVSQLERGGVGFNPKQRGSVASFELPPTQPWSQQRIHVDHVKVLGICTIESGVPFSSFWNSPLGLGWAYSTSELGRTMTSHSIQYPPPHIVMESTVITQVAAVWAVTLVRTGNPNSSVDISTML